MSRAISCAFLCNILRWRGQRGYCHFVMALLRAGKLIVKSVGLIICSGWEITYRRSTTTLFLSPMLTELPVSLKIASQVQRVIPGD